ncbi:MAG: B12-binding domain-containing radical SAM protein [Phycisphaerales bacterium]|nr:MAG: B12-binding domain-containing radical SAM protein [Phycisphaerales bacterium]
MNVVFVYPDLCPFIQDWPGAYYQGLAYLSAVLKEAGHSTSLIHVTDPSFNPDEIAETIDRRKPDLIAFSSTTNGFPTVRRLAGHFSKVFPHIPTVCGGIHSTVAPEDAIAAKGIDMICVGEGEGCIVDLCEALEKGEGVDRIANLWIKKEDGIIRNSVRNLIENLDELPQPDRELYDYPAMFVEQAGLAVFMASRGCPFSCTYCAHKGLRDSYRGKGRYVRFRSPENLIAELRSVKQRYGFVRGIHFDDDILFVNRAWAQRFAELYRREIDLPFRCNIHPVLCTDEIVDLAAGCGCRELRIGLESGNEYLRNQILKRKLDRDVIVSAFSNAKSRGIRLLSFNMIGLPEETPRRILETIKLNADCDIDLAQVSIFHPYPGTPLAEHCADKGLVSQRTVDDYYVGSILNLPDLSPRQLTMFQLYFKDLAKLYRRLSKLPRWQSVPLVWMIDWFLCRRIVPHVVLTARSGVHACVGRLRQHEDPNEQILAPPDSVDEQNAPVVQEA